MGLFGKQKNYAKLQEYILQHDAGELDWDYLESYMISNGIDEEAYNRVRREAHKKLADRGIVEHQNWYALLIAGINKDESYKYYNLAAEQGDVYAMKQLALAYSEASEGFEISFGVDPEREIFWRRKAAETGDPEALFDYAREFTVGELVPKDEDKAEQLYFESAQKGYLEACIGLAMLPKNMDNTERKIDLFTYVLRSGCVSEDVFGEAAFLLGAEYFPRENNKFADSRLSAYCYSLAYILGRDFLADSIRNTGYIAGDEWEKWLDDAHNLRFNP